MCSIAVRLPSYRSLPLSCLESIGLQVDGRHIDPVDIQFVVDGTAHRSDELSSLSHLWWFILDTEHLRVRLPHRLPRSTARVRARLVTVEPYISNGRFHFTSESDRVLPIVDARLDGFLRG